LNNTHKEIAHEIEKRKKLKKNNLCHTAVPIKNIG